MPTRVLLAGLLIVFLAGFGLRFRAAGSMPSVAAASADAAAIVVPPPVRDPPNQAVTPSLPAKADDVPALGFTMRTTRQRQGAAPSTATRQVYRSSRRVRLLDGKSTEWLFDRNPVHDDRVAGYLIDHGTKRVLSLDDSDLRNTQSVRGWADVLTMGFDPTVLRTLTPTGARTIVAGATFRQYVASAQRRTQGVLDVWWSEDLLLSLKLVVRDHDTTTTTTIRGLHPNAAASDQGPPLRSLDGYALVDLADANDGH